MNRALLYAAVLAIVVWTVAPFVWLVVSSLSFKVDLLTRPLHWIPRRVTLENYRELFLVGGRGTSNLTLFVRSLINSAGIAGGAAVVAITLGALSGYAVARLRFFGRSTFLGSILAAYMLPPISIVIPLFVILRTLGLLDTHLGLILVYLSVILPVVVWLMRGYYASIPLDLEEAALVDGATRLKAFVRVVLPLASPGLVAVAVFAFIAAWNEYLYALVFTSIQAKTLPVFIGELSTKLGLQYLQITAAGVLASVPPVVLAWMFQRFIIGGLTAGAGK